MFRVRTVPPATSYINNDDSAVMMQHPGTKVKLGTGHYLWPGEYRVQKWGASKIF